MDEEIIAEIKKLNEEVKAIIKKDSPDNVCIETLDDFEEDAFKHNFSLKDLKDILLKGIHLEDKHLYPDNPDRKHKGKNYYCICRRRYNIILVNYVLISYFKRPEIITLFHLSPLNYKSEEQRKYEEVKNTLKDSSLEKT